MFKYFCDLCGKPLNGGYPRCTEQVFAKEYDTGVNKVKAHYYNETMDLCGECYAKAHPIVATTSARGETTYSWRDEEKKRIYLYYEENYGEIAQDCDAVSDMEIFSELEPAIEHFKARGLHFEGRCIRDEESEKGEFDVQKLCDEFRANHGIISEIWFLHRQENWCAYFEQNVKETEVQ